MSITSFIIMVESLPEELLIIIKRKRVLKNTEVRSCAGKTHHSLLTPEEHEQSNSQQRHDWQRPSEPVVEY
jgi:hypothetical protein